MPASRRGFLAAAAALPALRPGSASAGPGLNDAIDEYFARAMASPAALIYEKRIEPKKKELFSNLDKSCQSVLEIGIGTSPNLKFYPPFVTSLTGVDPNPYMISSLSGAEKQQRLLRTPSGVVPEVKTMAK